MTTIVKGSLTAIPSELLNKANRVRGEYDWGKLDVGDHYVFPVEEVTMKKIRNSFTAYSRGTTGSKKKEARAPRKFAGIISSIKEEGKPEVKEFQVWRLPDPVTTSTEQVDTTPATQEQPKAKK